MTQDQELLKLFDEIVKILELEYGSIELRIHEGKLTHYFVTKRSNRPNA